MASPGTVNISAADQKDLDKVRLGFRCFSHLFQFIKYLAVKAVQVVVQARLGERVTAPRFNSPLSLPPTFSLGPQSIFRVKFLLNNFLLIKTISHKSPFIIMTFYNEIISPANLIHLEEPPGSTWQ